MAQEEVKGHENVVFRGNVINVLGMSVCRSQVDLLFNGTLVMHLFIEAFRGMQITTQMDIGVDD